jgi:hypothetical protein
LGAFALNDHPLDLKPTGDIVLNFRSHAFVLRLSKFCSHWRRNILVKRFDLIPDD